MCRRSGGNNLANGLALKMLNKKKLQSIMVSQSRLGTRSRATSLSYARPGDFAVLPAIRLFSVRLHVADSDEYFLVPDCHRDLTIRSLKNRLELLAGIPVNFQRIQYLDEVDLDDSSTFRSNDIISGGTITMQIWQEDAWSRLVFVAAKGSLKGLHALGATKRSKFRTAHAARLGPEELNNWIAHRAFVALFMTVRRGNLKAVEFLLENGADLHLKTPLGRTALHVAVTSGQLECIDILLNNGAKVSDEDNEGYNSVNLARLWGQKESERKLFRHQWQVRLPGGGGGAHVSVKT